MDDETFRRALTDARTRVHDLVGERMRTCRVDAGARLLPRDLDRDDRADLLLHVGTERDGTAHVVRPRDPGEVDTSAAGWRTLRECGQALGARDVGIFTTASALTRWHERHQRCPRCGAQTTAVRAGWVRRCDDDGSDHFPRTDPAVIVAVVDAADRLLLAHNAAWPATRMSILAGFVEPGETFEATVVREVQEEVGLTVSDLVYRGNQPWPFPASLMIGYTATSDTDDVHVDGVEIVGHRWFERGELAGAVRAGEVLLPSRVSIARHLIEDWYGGALEDADEATDPPGRLTGS